MSYVRNNPKSLIWVIYDNSKTLQNQQSISEKLIASMITKSPVRRHGCQQWIFQIGFQRMPKTSHILKVASTGLCQVIFKQTLSIASSVLDFPSSV